MRHPQARLLVWQAAATMDQHGNKVAKKLISQIKAVVPSVVQGVVDRAMQAFGAMGISQDTPLFFYWMQARSIRIADGPDETHHASVARLELRDQSKVCFANTHTVSAL